MNSQQCKKSMNNIVLYIYIYISSQRQCRLIHQFHMYKRDEEKKSKMKVTMYNKK